MASPSDLIASGSVFPTSDPKLDRSWLAAVHVAARVLSAEVVGLLEPVAVGRSFSRVTLRRGDGRLHTLMLNPAIRTVGAVRGDRPLVANADFVAVGSPASFVDSGFLIADEQVLASVLNEHQLSALDDAEASQVRYHRPTRVGDVIFNWFD